MKCLIAHQMSHYPLGCYVNCYLPDTGFLIYCPRSGMPVVRAPTSPSGTLRATTGLKRIRKWWDLSHGRKCHFRILLWSIWRWMVLHLHLLLGAAADGSGNNAAVHSRARIHWRKCAPKVVTSLSRRFLLLDLAGTWAWVHWRWLFVEYLHWYHTSKFSFRAIWAKS